MRKMFTLMLCLLLVFPAAVPALATETEGTPDSETTTPPIHTHTWDTVTTPATCTADGSSVSTCSDCGEVSTQILPAAGHAYGTWTIGESSHSRSCTVCGSVDSTAHSWTAGAVTVQPTCTATGSQVYNCVCGLTKTETIPMGIHTYGDWSITEESHSRSCSGCGNTESGAHAFGVTATVPATCLEEGAVAYGCTVCEGIVYEILPKLTTHTYETPCDGDCDVCGELREASHKFSTAWSRNSSQHWHTCSLCGEKTDIGSHYPGPAATEEKAQICLTCGLTLTSKRNHTHKYAADWAFDQGGHWYACSGCEEQRDYADHVYDNPCDPDCNVCGHRTDTAHTFDDNWLSDKRGHWNICTLCGQEGEPLAHTPDSDAGESEPQICTVCDFEIAPAREHIHKFEEDWITDEENHWKLCECGEKAEDASHIWEEDPEESSEETITYLCPECGAQRTEAAPEKSGFPWWAVLAGLLLITGCTAAILILHRKKSAEKFHR